MQASVNAFFKKLAIVAGMTVALTSLAFAGASPVWAASASATEDAESSGKHPLFHPQERSLSVWGMLEEDGKGGNESLLTLLKIDSATLQSELRAGKSLADIAKEKGVDRQKVVDLLVAQQKARLAQAVKDGKVTQEQAAKWSEGLKERTERFVDGKGFFKHRHGRMGHVKTHLDDTAQALGMSSQQLIDELKKGKSIAQIGKERGLSEETIVSRLLEKEKKRIQARIHRVWDKSNQVKQVDGNESDED